MLLIGVDYHPDFQQIAFLNQDTGECGELRLNHGDGEADRFYRGLQQRGIYVRIGMEATGFARWFERLLAELGFELWIGDPAEIKAKRVKKQKTDRKDAELLLKLMREDRFPRIWIPTPENRDLRQLLWHRHRLVTNAYADCESAVGVGHERRAAPEEEVMERAGTSRIGKAAVSSLGWSASA
jgi:transposase